MRKTPLEKLPARIKYYLLEWKDVHMNEYISMYGETKMNELNKTQLKDLFLHASNKDFNSL